MPNALAYLVLFGFPLFAVVLFRLLPLQRALIWTILLGHLFLPSEMMFKIPMLPGIDRALVPAVTAWILCALMAPKLQPAADMASRSGRQVIFALLGLVLLTPFLTVLQNMAPIIDGRTYLPGLRLYDAISMISQIVINLIPLWLGIRYLNTHDGHKALLEAFAITGLIYTFPALLEIRLSPQLHSWIYGYFPHDFVQHIRDGGFRPVVFLNHGLMVGIYFCISIIAAVVLYREARREQRNAWPWLLAAVWLVGVLFLSKSLGALALALGFGLVVLLLGRRPQIIVAVVVGFIVILYPMLRGAGLIPIDTVMSIVESINEDRARSLQFRIDNEEALLAHANEKPLAGWGSWGRNSLYDPDTGAMTSVTDGIWVFFIGVFGWLGYIGRFGLLTIPILFFALRSRQLGPSLITPGLMVVLAATLVDLLPNAGLVNYIWLMAGAVAGLVLWREPEAGGTTAAAGGGGVGLPLAPRAGWLMVDAPVAAGRQKRSESRGRIR